MKVNTDGVLLGAWLRIPQDAVNVLDIGTGTGVISLIIAQRLSNVYSPTNIRNTEGKNSSIFIEAIDIDMPSVDEANYNFSQSPWAEHLRASKISLQDFLNVKSVRDGLPPEEYLEKYDLIVSNPPYFIDSLKAPSARRSSSRHNHELPYEVIIEASVTLLNKDGVLAIVLPAEEGEKFISLSSKSVETNSACEKATTLHLARRCRVKTLAWKKEKRYLLEFVKSERRPAHVEEILIMQEKGGLEYTEQYKNLTKEFYLKF